MAIQRQIPEGARLMLDSEWVVKGGEFAFIRLRTKDKCGISLSQNTIANHALANMLEERTPLSLCTPDVAAELYAIAAAELGNKVRRSMHDGYVPN